jgi:hypothetical protein
MPCCAFAAFVLSQFVFGIAAIRRVVLGRRAAAASPGLSRNPVVEWRLSVPSSFRADAAQKISVSWRSHAVWRWGFLVVGALEIMLLVGGIYVGRAYFLSGSH